jgi:hypothetical protein
MKSQSPLCAYNGVKVIQFSGIAISALIGGLLKVEGSGWPDFAVRLLTWSHNSAWWIVPACAAVTIGSKSLSTALGPPKVWKSIQRALDKHRDVAFELQDGDPAHYYRVTLFKKSSMGGMYPARNILGMGLVAMAYFRMAGTGRPIWAYNPKNQYDLSGARRRR